MGDRDQTLVQSLGIRVAELASALDKSRQTVNRGIRGHNNYLRPADLIRALEVWRSSNTGLYAVAKSKICELYPEVADSILELTRSSGSVEFSTGLPGEYWMICGDFVGFRNTLPSCAKQIEHLCALKTAQVKIFVNERDYFAAERLASKFQHHDAQAIRCRFDLRFFPTTLLRMDYDDTIDLFGVSDAGFTPLSRKEATRLRVMIQDVLLRPSATSITRLQGVDAN
jgi:hypothetical protein